MDKEIIIDGDLGCDNCLERARCEQQQEAKEQRINAILSYITNEDNEKYIAELKNEIPAVTRCDVVLEKQLKRLEQENKELKEKIIKLTEENGNLIINRNTVENKLRDTESRLISVQKANTHNLVLLQRRNNALEEIREIAMGIMDDDMGEGSAYYDANQIINKINEVLK